LKTNKILLTPFALALKRITFVSDMGSRDEHDHIEYDTAKSGILSVMDEIKVEQSLLGTD
jgi:hypothetical protein